MNKRVLVVFFLVMALCLLGCEKKQNVNKHDTKVEKQDENKLSKQSGLYSVNGELKFTWEELIEQNLIEMNGDWLTKYNYYYEADLVIDDSVVGIDEGAFHTTSKEMELASVEIPGTVKTIKEQAFYSCKNLKSVILHDGITEIGDYAFNACSSLESIEFPSTVETIGDCSLAFCKSLRKVTLPEGTTELKDGMFAYCSALESTNDIANIENIISIGESCFSKCVNLKSVVLTDSIESIGKSAFEETAIEKIEIPGKIERIENSTFSRCKFLKEAIVGNGITEIGEYAFSRCDELQSVQLPDSLEVIEMEAFNECKKLDVVVPDNVNYIDHSSFWNVKHIEYHGSAADDFDEHWGAEKFN